MVFSYPTTRKLFDYYQYHILRFVNTDHGRSFLSDSFGGKIEYNDRIVRVTPDSFHILKDVINGKPVIQATFFPRSPYLTKFSETLTYLSIMEDYQDLNKLSGKDIAKLGQYIYCTTSTYNPDADAETTSVDGRVGRITVTEGWSTIRAGAGNYSSDTGTSANTILIRKGASTNWTDFVRGIFLFDTSAIPDGDDISSAVFSLHITSHENTIARYGRLTTSTPASNTALANSDYANVGTTAQATDILISGVSDGAYSDWTLNSTGISNISKTGITKLGLRVDSDADNSEPSASSGEGAALEVKFADNGSSKPKLVITYSPGGGLYYMSV